MKSKKDITSEEKSVCTKVIIDNYKCGYQATRHLIEQSCKKIVLVTANLKRNEYAQRYKGYMDALCDHNIPIEKELVLFKDQSEQCGVEAATQIRKMKPLPDGAFITCTQPYHLEVFQTSAIRE
jgi:LacI family transcriptional regulator